MFSTWHLRVICERLWVTSLVIRLPLELDVDIHRSIDVDIMVARRLEHYGILQRDGKTKERIEERIYKDIHENDHNI